MIRIRGGTSTRQLMNLNLERLNYFPNKIQIIGKTSNVPYNIPTDTKKNIKNAKKRLISAGGYDLL